MTLFYTILFILRIIFLFIFILVFSPDYANPGAVNDASLTSPESQILTAPNIVGFLNGMMSMVDTGLNKCFGGFGLKSVSK